MGYQSRINVDEGTNTNNISELLRQAFALKHLRTQQQQSINQQQNVGDQLRRAQDADALAAEKYKQQMQQQQMQQNGPFIPGISQMPMNQQNPMRQQPPKSLYQALLNNPSFRVFAEQNGLGQFVENQAMQNMLQQGSNPSAIQGGAPSFNAGNTAPVGGGGQLSQLAKNPEFVKWYKEKTGTSVFNNPELKHDTEVNKEQYKAQQELADLEDELKQFYKAKYVVDTDVGEGKGEGVNESLFGNSIPFGIGEWYQNTFTENPRNAVLNNVIGTIVANTNKKIAAGGRPSVSSLNFAKDIKLNKQGTKYNAQGSINDTISSSIDNYNKTRQKAGMPPLSAKERESIEQSAYRAVVEEIQPMMDEYAEKHAKKDKKIITQESQPMEFDTSSLKDTDRVIVETPEGDKVMTYAEAKKLGAI